MSGRTWSTQDARRSYRLNRAAEHRLDPAGSLGILGDAAAALPMLSKALGGTKYDGEARVSASGGPYKEINVDDWKDAERVHPRRLARILSEVLPSHATVTCDAGRTAYTCCTTFSP